MNKVRTVGEGALLIAIALAAWQIVVMLKLASSTTFPPPSEIAMAGWREIESGSLFDNVLASLFKYAVGYIVGAALGVVFGVLIGTSRTVDELSRVPLHASRQIPGLAWIPVAILWFGIGDLTSIFVIILASFFPTTIYTAAGVRNVDSILMRAAMTLGVRAKSLFALRKVILPGALPQIMIGLRVAVATSWTSIVAAEMVGSQAGMGYLIQFYRLQYRIDRVIFYMVAIGILGLVFDQAIRIVERRLLAWQIGTKAHR